MLLDSCIFCKIIKGAIPCHKVLETPKLLAFLDINPIAEGHILIIPKYHAERLHQVPSEYLSELLPSVAQIAERLLVSQGMAYNILQNNGKLAGQEVDHVHLHLIPRLENGEGLSVQWRPMATDHAKFALQAAEFRAKLGQE